MPAHKAKIPAVGASSLLVIFAVLCLITFAILDLSTHQANKRLFTALSDSVTSYYQADSEAQTVLATLRAGDKPENYNIQQDGRMYAYQIPISAKSYLACQVQIQPDASYQILTWAVTPAQEWTGDFNLPVFQN